MSKWKKATMAPSNSEPLPVLSVVGEKAFQMMFSQELVAMNREIPLPSLKTQIKRGEIEKEVRKSLLLFFYFWVRGLHVRK